MKRMSILFTAMAALAMAPLGTAQAFLLKNDRAKFSVELPLEPSHSLESGRRVARRGLVEAELRIHHWSVPRWNVEVAVLSKEDLSAGEPNLILDKLAPSSGGYRDLKYGELVVRELVTGAKTKFLTPQALSVSRVRVFIVNGNYIRLAYRGPHGTERNTDVDAVFNSLRILP